MNKIIFLFFLFLSIQKGNAQQIDLAGQWKFSLDAQDQGVKEKWFNQTLKQTIQLPGTTDEAGFGISNSLEPKLEKPQLLHLTRKNSYVGAAWYSKEVIIPETWKGKSIILKLERVIWNTTVWVDGKQSTSNESLISPHYFDLSNLLLPGKHHIIIRIDNRKQHEMSVNNMAHSYTNETQIMWNGVIGNINLEATDPIKLSSIRVFPDIDHKKIKVDVEIVNHTTSSASGNLTIQAISKTDTRVIKTLIVKVNNIEANKTVSLEYPMGKDFKQWDEFSPNLYTLNVTLKGNNFSSKKTAQFGMRKLTNKNALLQINNRRLFLRGTLECCIFPLTGRPPMKKEEWQTVFSNAKKWGLNHLRFHSWCPPQAAFEAADEAGFYLHVELPLWYLKVGDDSLTMRFLRNEAQNIIREYGNHPSFCFWSMGNELEGDFDQLNSLMVSLKKQDPRHLYTSTSYTFQKGHNLWPGKNDDYYITQYTKKGWVRGQGIFDAEAPRFDKDYSTSIDGLPVPIISHEIGQYSVYPNMEEIKKYTGVLTPLNFIAIQKDLERKGLIGKAKDYLMASGKLAVILYKEEIERAMKTPGLSGFQLLDLHDFPGQGTALVGLLDAFWDSKGLIPAAEFRQFCAPVVPLIRFPKAVYENTETFEATTEVVNFGSGPLKDKTISWQIKDKAGNDLATGHFNSNLLSIGNNRIPGKISFPLKGIKTAAQLSVSLKIEGTIYENKWKIWVYPKTIFVAVNDVVITQSFEQANKALQAGHNVLLTPDWKKLKGIEGKFVPVFWSPVHFPAQAGTMGVLCNPKHPAFSMFPTEMNADWQWWDLCKDSKTMIIDSLKGVTPLVEMVDNFANNRRLASIFEVKSGKGKLIFSSIDLFNDMDNRPVARQLRYSLIQYMNSQAFNPTGSLSLQEIQSVLTEK